MTAPSRSVTVISAPSTMPRSFSRSRSQPTSSWATMAPRNSPCGVSGIGAGKRREHADGEALPAEHVPEIAASVVALGLAPGRRLAGDPSADVEHRQRDEVRQAALQRRKIGWAGGTFALDDARRMGDGAE